MPTHNGPFVATVLEPVEILSRCVTYAPSQLRQFTESYVKLYDTFVGAVHDLNILWLDVVLLQHLLGLLTEGAVALGDDKNRLLTDLLLYLIQTFLWHDDFTGWWLVLVWEC